MASPTRTRVAIIGMGGYAARHHEAVLELERRGEVVLECTCDPKPERFGEQAEFWKLKARGVAVYSHYIAMLDKHAASLDVVIIPTPIPLHAEMHAAVIERGLAVYLEKPPTLDPEELERMIVLDRKARVPTLVGFNFIAEPERQALKQRVASGEFGAIREARLFGFWGRSTAYYGRSTWAGRLLGPDNRLILDSCLGNGFSHHVHNLLHWGGTGGVDTWASPKSVRAALLRAHDIEGADTCFAEVETDQGARLRIAISHACRGPELHRETLVCDHAEIDYVTRESATVRWLDGRTERYVLEPFDAQLENLKSLVACLDGTREKPPTTLADSRPFVHLHALAYLSSTMIEDFDEALIERDLTATNPARYLSVRGLREDAERFLNQGEWRGPTPTLATPLMLCRLEATVRGMGFTRGAVASAS